MGEQPFPSILQPWLADRGTEKVRLGASADARLKP
jgi:hypothetical protein